jgi:inorganic triphosphatase YgiF
MNDDEHMSDKGTSLPRSFESEIALVIKEKGNVIAKDIAGITSILKYDLKPRSLLRIHDTYYDTKKGSLRKKQITLRVRKIDDAVLLTLKSNPRRAIGGTTRRREVEVPWSLKSLAQFAQCVKLKIPRVEISKFSEIKPSKVFRLMGLYAVQERLTRRETRDIIRHDKPRAPPLAELAIDDVTFLLGSNRVRLFEVEIEAKTARSLPRVRIIADALTAMYPGLLKEWPHGKLATGLAIRRLLKTKILQNYLDRDRLKPEVFQLIDETIRSTRL